MDFDFSDEQRSLREAVQRWGQRDFGFERRLALVGTGGHSREVWRELAALGLTGLQVPEADGGMGLGPVEAMVVMEELGRALVHLPFAAAALIAPTLLARSDRAPASSWLARIARGDAMVVLAHQERAARYRLQHVLTRATPQGTGFVLTGVKSLVPAGDEADAFLVPARVGATVDDPAGIALFLVERDAPGLSLRGYPTQDGARAAELQLQGVPAQTLMTQAHDALALAADVGIAAACAEAVGAMEQLIAMTAEYMNTRRQFGVPIASFQALRHRMADLKMALELSRSMSYYASLKLGEEAQTRRRALSQAKVQLGRSMRLVGQECIQLHGGIGVTDEYAASHYFKRLTVLETAWGDTLHHLGEVSDRMQDSAGVFA